MTRLWDTDSRGKVKVRKHVGLGDSRQLAEGGALAATAAWTDSELLGGNQAALNRIATAVETAMQSAEVRERIAGIGVEVDYRRSDEFARSLKEQQARFADIIKKGNIKLE